MSDSESRSSSPELKATPAKKRKADDMPEDDKLEIDVSLPEPPSKKAKRAEKKAAKRSTTTPSDKPKKITKEPPPGDEDILPADENAAATTAPVRSEYGIWMGNLPFTATRDTVRDFLKDQGGIDGADIVRLHMPTPDNRNHTGPIKPQNKGFAYVDFPTQAVLDIALALSEKLMGGRRVLIKNAKSFEGRPQKTAGEETAGAAAAAKKDKAATKRVFVGNLSFDVTREDLQEHFEQVGGIEDIHMATFEDSGKCKGFAWIRFNEVEAAEAAVKGFIYRREEEDGSDEEDGNDSDGGKKKMKKPKARRHKQHVNFLHGRELRREFAEDAQTRYKKRYQKGDGKSGPRGDRDATAGDDGDGPADSAGFRAARAPRPEKKTADDRRMERRKRHEDARNIAPGQALANAPRNTGSIVAAAGKKTSFA